MCGLLVQCLLIITAFSSSSLSQNISNITSPPLATTTQQALTNITTYPRNTTKVEESSSSIDVPVWVWGLVGGLILLVVVIITLCYIYKKKSPDYSMVNGEQRNV